MYLSIWYQSQIIHRNLLQNEIGHGLIFHYSDAQINHVDQVAQSV